MIGYRRQPQVSCNVKEFLQIFKVKNEKICKVMELLDQEIRNSLAGDKTSSTECYQTYVQDFPTGMETGRYLVLDLSGLHFRIMLFDFLPWKKYNADCRTFTFPEERMSGHSADFFDYLAECIEIFVTDQHLEKEALPLSFCFSFPVKTKGLTKAYLMKWTKSFSISGVQGEDIIELLRKALMQRRVNIGPIVLLNDTTSCLLSCHWTDKKCRIGVIVGAGTNVCYMEKTENIRDFDGDPTKPFMIINTELGHFGSSGHLEDIRTVFDKEVDEMSKYPGSQIFEKMISDYHFSELVRLVILECIKLKYLFDGERSDVLERRRCFMPEFIYEIEGDDTRELKRTLGILEIMKFKHATIQDCVNVRYICKTICRRSAKLLAAAVATIVNKMDIGQVVVAYDGSVYKKHPTYKEILREKISGYVNQGIAVDHRLSDEGAGLGAALLIAMYMQQQQNKTQNSSPAKTSISVSDSSTSAD